MSRDLALVIVSAIDAKEVTADVGESELGPDRLAADAYLRSSHGFLVDTALGREVGVVEDVELDPKTGYATRLVVCGGWFGRRRRLIDVADIESILPGERRLIVVERAAADAPPG